MELQLATFLGIATLVIVTPGPDTALTIRNTLQGGRRGGLGTALGVATGQAVWTVAASAGVAAILLASAPAFAALRLAGATYLVWLGVQAMCPGVYFTDEPAGRTAKIMGTGLGVWEVMRDYVAAGERQDLVREISAAAREPHEGPVRPSSSGGPAGHPPLLARRPRATSCG